MAPTRATAPVWGMATLRKMPGESALRKGRCSLPGHAYFVTFTTWRRKPWFCDWEKGCAMSRLLAASDHWRGARLLAWVLMPDHWHGLLVLQPEATLSGSLRLAKGASARAFNAHLGRKGPVWGAGFHDRAVRREEGLRAAARYLVANPLRAGLVQRVGDYPFWDAAWLVDDCPV